ncbi:MAG: AraC family transcriptional regulator [SAR324 cluster bacterium]|nr:AraC family transcriptional regulator [SAR324 cluster bacterium]
MLSHIKKLKIGSSALPLEHSKRLPCAIWGAGTEIQTSSQYDWDGLKRGSLPLATFQYTIKGCGKLRYESEDFEIPSGHAMLVRFPHNHRYWLPAKWEPWHLFWVSLYGEEIQKLWQQIEEKTGPVVRIPEDSPLFEIYCEIHEVVLNNPIFSPYRTSALGYQFAMKIMDELLNPELKAPRREIQSVVQYCETHYHNYIGVEEMAEISGLSRYHFTRLFREIVGVPPGIFLRTLRMRKSVELLRNGQHSVKVISDLCGFADVNNFCRAFKRIYGFSPGMFKNNGL